MKIPQQSIVYMVICLSGIMLFVLLGIFPSQRVLANLEEKIAESNYKIEEQKVFMPVSRIVKERTQKKSPRGLPVPAKSPLAQEQVDLLNASIKEISGRANLEVVSILPALGSLSISSKSMAIETLLRGNFYSFRKFLAGLGGIPSVEHIEEIQIRQYPEWLELKVKFWVERP